MRVATTVAFGLATAMGAACCAHAAEVSGSDVIKGPSALVNGAAPGASVGGSINLIPKRAGDRPVLQFTGSFSGESVFGGHLDFGQRFGADEQFGVRFNGVFREGDTAVERQSIESKLATVAVDYRGERLIASADLGYQEQRIDGIRDFSFIDSSFPVPEAPDADTNFDGPNDFSHPKVFYGMLRARYALSDQ